MSLHIGLPQFLLQLIDLHLQPQYLIVLLSHLNYQDPIVQQLLNKPSYI